MLDFVQVVSDHLGRLVGLDDDAVHWLGVAVRESVINAIKHGNAGDSRKRVHVEFTPLEGARSPRSVGTRARRGDRVRPDASPGPARAREPPQVERARHLPHRSFMDQVELRQVPEGGMEVTMVKRACRISDSSPRTG